MIKKGNVAVSLNSGKVGNVRYYTKAGKTYTRVASSDMQNPRTLTDVTEDIELTATFQSED